MDETNKVWDIDRYKGEITLSIKCLAQQLKVLKIVSLKSNDIIELERIYMAIPNNVMHLNEELDIQTYLNKYPT